MRLMKLSTGMARMIRSSVSTVMMARKPSTGMRTMMLRLVVLMMMMVLMVTVK
jgi:hypothetical protein